jgi:hypothetical protein
MASSELSMGHTAAVDGNVGGIFAQRIVIKHR